LLPKWQKTINYLAILPISIAMAARQTALKTDKDQQEQTP
jgi:hypothetical protein